MDRNAWTWLIGVIAVGAIVLLISTNQTLTNTQEDLEAAQATATGQVDAMVAQAAANAAALDDAATEAVNAQSTAVADAQNSAATAQADTVTQAQNDAATAQAQAVSDAQNADATAQASALTDAQNANATAQASALAALSQDDATAQAQAVTDVQNEAATAQAQAVTDAQNSAATAQAAVLAQAQNEAATAQAQAVTDAQNTAQAQFANDLMTPIAATQQALETQIAQAQVVAAASPTLPAETNSTPAGSAALPAGWQRIEGKGVAMALPESFQPTDLLNQNPQAIASSLRALGPGFEAAASLFEQNANLIVFFTYDNRSKGGGITNVNILTLDVGIEVPLQTMLDATLQQLPSQFTVLEHDVVHVGQYDAGRIVSTASIGAVQTKQIQYLFVRGTHLWVATFSTDPNQFDTYLPVFEQSIQTIEFTENT